MKKTIILIALCTLVAFVSGTMAQQKLEKFSGVIEKVDEGAKAIEVKGKVNKEEKTLTFIIGEEANITKGKETLSFADLKQGMDISVEYKKDGEKMVAVAIKVSAPKAVK